MPRSMPQPKSVSACFLPRNSCGARTTRLRSFYAIRTNIEKPAETPLPVSRGRCVNLLRCKMRHSVIHRRPPVRQAIIAATLCLPLLTASNRNWLRAGSPLQNAKAPGEHGSAPSPRDAPELCNRFALFENERAQGRPGARCTRGLVCDVHKRKCTRAYRFSGEHPAFPAQWLYGL
jgi:hypothetical protein